jgi:protein TonB
LSLTLCVSLGFHGCLLFVSFRYQNIQGTAKQKLPDRNVSLVNLALIEPPTPEKLPEPPIPNPEPPGVESEPAETEAPVETFISLEPSPPDHSTSADPQAESRGASGIRAYLKSNYDYIQRHIRSNLIYPPEARQAGIQGIAELSFVIHIDGQVSDVKITLSSGSEILDASAVEAIYSAAPFRPPPSKARLIIPVAFRIR